jgi:hypothetical protein
MLATRHFTIARTAVEIIADLRRYADKIFFMFVAGLMRSAGAARDATGCATKAQRRRRLQPRCAEKARRAAAPMPRRCYAPAADIIRRH